MKRTAMALAIVAALAACSDEDAHPQPPVQAIQAEVGSPLRAWMRSNAQGPLVAGNLAAVAVAFDRIETLAPSGYEGWAGHATRGAAAARKGDQEALRAACKQCHDDFRARYRGEFRARALVTKTR